MSKEEFAQKYMSFSYFHERVDKFIVGFGWAFKQSNANKQPKHSSGITCFPDCFDRYPKKCAHSCGISFSVSAIFSFLVLCFSRFSINKFAITTNRRMLTIAITATRRKNKILSVGIIFARKPNVKRIMNQESIEPVSFA